MVNATKAPMEDAFVVYYRCYCPILVTERGCNILTDVLTSLVVSIIAGVTCHYICKWLDRYFRQ